jgi:hypothetical protein
VLLEKKKEPDGQGIKPVACNEIDGSTACVNNHIKVIYGMLNWTVSLITSRRCHPKTGGSISLVLK